MSGARSPSPERLPDPQTFLSGESGTVAGKRLVAKARLADAGIGVARALALTGPRLDRAAAALAPQRVLALSVYRPGSRLPEAIGQLRSARHAVHFALGSTGAPDPSLAAETVARDMTGGKFQNLNRLLAAAVPVADHDWVVVADDDIDLPSRFLDRMLAVCERLSLDLAQPAQTRRSHAAWRVTRRRAWSLARRTQYVEIGPLTVFRREVAQELMPFPDLRFGWGLDNHWGALAREHDWRLGIVDALAVRHEQGKVAAAYTHAEAIEEGRSFLAGREYLPSHEAQRTLATVRRLR